MSRYKHFVFEGGNKSGKSEVVAGVKSWMEEQNMPVATVREPGGTAIGEEIRRVLLTGPERPPETDVLLFNAARAATVKRIGELLLGSHVLADRSYISTLAFQIHGDGAPDVTTRQICNFALGKNYRPDAVFLLDTSYESYTQRSRSADEHDYFEREKKHYERVRQGFIKEIKAVDGYIIDGSQPRPVVRSAVTAIIEGLL